MALQTWLLDEEPHEKGRPTASPVRLENARDTSIALLHPHPVSECPQHSTGKPHHAKGPLMALGGPALASRQQVQSSGMVRLP